ncbi:class F sortase [Streptomyces sp. NPDC012510]|uniref:class F sortase n=1 Tax=Streptomyces sp. NPDC012510 TaxID=3364838 RepID=UPI0036EE86AC
MARRRRRPRPWYRTRAYRLTRTAVMAVALVVGGIHLAEERERPDPAEAGTARADTGSRGAGAPRDRAPLYPSPPPSRAGTPGTTPTERTGRTERAEPTERTEPTERAEPTARLSPWPGEPTWPARTTAMVPPPTEPTGPAPTAPDGPTPTEPALPAPARPARPDPAAPVEPPLPAKPRTLPPSPAKTVSIPYLGIKAPVTELHLDGRRRLPAPPHDKPKLVGWYAEGPAPGGPGTAVVVGHRDTRRGPAVFAALGMIKPGRIVEVLRADGRTAVYTVDAVQTYEKDRFPSQVVYGPRDRPELRLITCGGVYDRRKGYASNVVVFAHLTTTREPARKP